MGLFRRNEDDTQEQEKRPVNPTNMVTFRLLAIGYLLWSLWQMVKLYQAGGEDKPSVPLMIAAVVLFFGGSVWIAWITYKQWKQLKAAQLEDDDDDDDDDEDPEEESEQIQEIGDASEGETE